MAKYEIKDLNQFTESARRVVFGGFGKSVEETKDGFTDMLESLSGEEETEMNKVLSQQESILIVKSLIKTQTNKKTQAIRYIINEKVFEDVLDALNARLVSNILSNLMKRGLIESAYDDKLNDFVFWVKEDENKNNKKSDTNRQ
jgi:regulator of PEP synthase PpsR (kinase-PPPase family)